MTAQVGILNKTSAVIASDSASSLSNSSKILNSADKIYKISGDVPVGIMIND
jgi:20S proteasome alpha/beta subunit